MSVDPLEGRFRGMVLDWIRSLGKASVGMASSKGQTVKRSIGASYITIKPGVPWLWQSKAILYIGVDLTGRHRTSAGVAESEVDK